MDAVIDGRPGDQAGEGNRRQADGQEGQQRRPDQRVRVLKRVQLVDAMPAALVQKVERGVEGQIRRMPDSAIVTDQWLPTRIRISMTPNAMHAASIRSANCPPNWGNARTCKS